MKDSIIDQIKDKLDIVDVIGETITLTPAGKNKYTGTVGVKGNSGKSLHVDGSNQLFYDFKNKVGGDVLNWIAYREGLDNSRDIKEIITLAAGKAGIVIEHYNGNIEHAQEQNAIHDLYTQAAGLYHAELTEDLYKHIMDKWGISKETVDTMKIGFAPVTPKSDFLTKQFRQKEEKETLIKSGLVLKFDNGKVIDFFNGRVVFPYWKNGKVVYFIARAIEGITERNKWECHTDKAGEPGEYIKYKKLLTPGEKHPYVSELAGNNYFYGEDSIRRTDYTIITEGVTDCITAIQKGFPCISPVTVQFRDSDYPKLYELVQKKESVYICNDSEVNNAGLTGAIKTGDYLEKLGINVKMVVLDRGTAEKIDLAEYLKTNTAEDFNTLIADAIPLYEYKMFQIKPASRDTERIRQAKRFCIEELAHIDETIRYAFIRRTVKDFFKLKAEDITDLIKVVKVGIKQIEEQGKEEQEAIKEEVKKDLDEEGISEEAQAQARAEAGEILRNGDVMDYLTRTLHTIHTGDDRAAEGLILSIASQSCTNTAGLQVKLSGGSGGGKTHLMSSILILLRRKHYYNTSLTPKAAYHMNIKPGTVLFSDDTDISEDMESTIKRAMSNFQGYTVHNTVQDGDGKEVMIPPRIVWLYTSVDDYISDQLLNRILVFDVDTTPAQDERVYEMQIREAIEGEIKTHHVTHEVLVCRYILDIIKDGLFKIKIPYADQIDIADKANRRVLPQFFDMVKGFTILKHQQREKDEEGYILANMEDFNNARKLFLAQTDNIGSKTNEKERKVLTAIAGAGRNGADINYIAQKTGMEYGAIHRILKGRKDRGGCGLLDKAKGLKKEDQTITEGDETLRTSERKEVYILDSVSAWKYYENGFVFLKAQASPA